MQLPRRREECRLLLAPHRGIRSHFPDQGQWVANEVDALIAGWNATISDWQAEAAEVIFMLPENRFLAPDLTLKEAGKPLFHLEYLPRASWSYLARRLEALAGYTERSNLSEEPTKASYRAQDHAQDRVQSRVPSRVEYRVVCPARVLPSSSRWVGHPALITYQRRPTPLQLRRQLQQQLEQRSQRQLQQGRSAEHPPPLTLF